jgi:hypothetical protein
VLAGRNHARLVQGLHHAAIGREALDDLQPMPPRHQRLGLVPGQIEHVGHADAPDLQHVAESAGRDQPGPGARALEDGVGADRGPVQDLFDIRACNVQFPEQGIDTRHHGPARFVRRGRDLALVQGAVARHDDNVGECSADIDRNPDT